MENELEKDTLLSHSIINYLFSLYQGEYAAQNVLILLQAPGAKPESLEALGSSLTKILEWYHGLSKGDCLFSANWTSAQTFEAKKALELLKASKAPLANAAKGIRAALTNIAIDAAPEYVLTLVSGYVRFTTGSKFYSEGSADLGTILKRPDINKKHELAVKLAAQDNLQAYHYTEEYKKGKDGIYDHEFLAQLRADCVRIPGALRAQIHDINQILSQYSGGFSFTAAEFSPAEAEVWEQVKIGPDAAGYWRAYDFSPSEAIEWTKAGIPSPGVAALWKISLFNSAEAAEWSKAGFTPALAKKWADANYPVNEALSYAKRGYPDPDKLPQGE